MRTRREDDGVSAASSHPCGHQEQQTVVSLCIILHCIVHNAHILCPLLYMHFVHSVQSNVTKSNSFWFLSASKTMCIILRWSNQRVCVQCTVCILCNNQMSPTVANISPCMHIVTTCNKLCCAWCQCTTAALGAAKATLLNLAVLWCARLKWIFCFSFLFIVSTNTELK